MEHQDRAVRQELAAHQDQVVRQVQVEQVGAQVHQELMEHQDRAVRQELAAHQDQVVRQVQVEQVGAQVLQELRVLQVFLYHLHQVRGVLLFRQKVNISQVQQPRIQ
jgi:hypothetical protein